jgi:hypothetical protein
MRLRNAFAFASAAVVTSILFSQGIAKSTTYYSHFRNAHASHCQSNNPLTINSVGQLANTQLSGADVFCPVDDTNSLVPGTKADIHLAGYGNGSDGGLIGNTWSAACRTAYFGGGGKCGPLVYTSSGPGVFQLTPSTTAWDAPEDAKYIYVHLGGQSRGSSNVIWSYSVNQFELTP